MSLNTVYNVFTLFVLSGEIRTDLNVCTLNFKVDRLPDVVEKSPAFCKIYVHTEFRCHKPCKMSNFERML